MKILIAILVVVGAFVLFWFFGTERVEKGAEQGTVSISDLLIVPRVGMGPIKFGMSKDEVIKHFGRPDFAHGIILTYAAKGVEFVIKEPRGVTSIIGCAKECFFGSRAERLAKDFEGATDKGIRIGASEKQIVAVYGQPLRRRIDGSQVTLRYKDQGPFVFTLESGRLIKIWALK